LDTIEKTSNFFSINEKVKPTHTEKSAVHLSELPIKSVMYTSLCLLNENQLVIIDNKNCSIYIIEDLLENKILSALPMPSAPWGVAKVNDNEVVITFPELGVARFLTLSDTMTVMKTEDVKVGYECYGITCGRKRLVVTYLDPARVKILDMSGNVLKCFDESAITISSPKHLALSPNKRYIYISDNNKNIVISMTFDGKVKAIYKDDQLAAPIQLAVDREGLVYVCGRGSNNVHQLSADLKKMKLLVDDKHNLVKPVSIALCENVDRLYLGTFNSNVIQVFSLYQNRH
jgi:DNA-binding beta-propeller fold protein YncE